MKVESNMLVLMYVGNDTYIAYHGASNTTRLEYALTQLAGRPVREAVMPASVRGEFFGPDEKAFCIPGKTLILGNAVRMIGSKGETGSVFPTEDVFVLYEEQAAPATATDWGVQLRDALIEMEAASAKVRELLALAIK